MAELKGSKTEKNLKEAIVNESFAHTKYQMYAEKAKSEGYVQIAEIFKEASYNEKQHAEIWNWYLNEGNETTTKDNLEDSSKCEEHEWKNMYEQYAKDAEEEGFDELAFKFRMIKSIEQKHDERFKKLLENIENDEVFSKDEDEQWICDNCGFVYEDKEAPKNCPFCGYPQGYFQIRAQNY